MTRLAKSQPELEIKNSFFVIDIMKKFSFPKAESPTAFFSQNSLRFGCRIRKRDEANLTIPRWLSLLNKIRTFFKENPDAEF